MSVPHTDSIQGERLALADLLETVLDHGVVIAGDLTLSLAEVDLVYVGLRLVIGAPDKLLGETGS